MTAVALRAILIDDEPLAREMMSRSLLALGVNVVASCRDGTSAVDVIRQYRPDILFLDVEMPELDGFAMLERLEPEEIPPAVIFVTAYDHYAVRAFAVSANDYLLKPVSPDRLRAALERATQRVREVNALRRADVESAVTLGTERYLTQLTIRDRDEQIIIAVRDIEWIEAETYYVRIHATGHRPRLLRERMSTLERRLDPTRFVRTHRSAIVRTDLVRSIRTLSRYEAVVLLSTGREVPVSRERRSAVERALASG